MRCGRKIELVVTEDEGVSARKEDVTNFRVLFEIAKRFLEVGVQFLFADATHHPAPGAIAAVTRAPIRHQKEDAIGIPMHQSRYRHMGIFATRVGHVVRRSPGFLDPRDDLAPDRAIRVIALDQVEKVRSDGQSELCPGKQHAGPLLIRQLEMLLKLSQRGNPVFELPFPVVPEFRRDRGPIAGRR